MFPAVEGGGASVFLKREGEEGRNQGGRVQGNHRETTARGLPIIGEKKTIAAPEKTLSLIFIPPAASPRRRGWPEHPAPASLVIHRPVDPFPESAHPPPAILP